MNNNILNKVEKHKKEQFLKKHDYVEYVIDNSIINDINKIWIHKSNISNINNIINDYIEIKRHTLDESFETAIINLIVDKLNK